MHACRLQRLRHAAQSNPPDLAISAFAAEPQATNRASKSSRLAALLPKRIASPDSEQPYRAGLGAASDGREATRDQSGDHCDFRGRAADNRVTACRHKQTGRDHAGISGAGAITAGKVEASAAAASCCRDHSRAKHARRRPDRRPEGPACASPRTRPNTGPPVETALRDVVRTQLRGTSTRIARGRSPQHRRQQPRSAEADLGSDAAADAAARRPEDRSAQARPRHRTRAGRLTDLSVVPSGLCLAAEQVPPPPRCHGVR